MVILLGDDTLLAALKKQKILKPQDCADFASYMSIIDCAKKESKDIIERANIRASEILKKAKEEAERITQNADFEAMLKNANIFADVFDFIESNISGVLLEGFKIIFYDLSVSDVAISSVKRYIKKFGQDVNYIDVDVPRAHCEKVQEAFSQYSAGASIRIHPTDHKGNICKISSSMNSININYEKILTIIAGLLDAKL